MPADGSAPLVSVVLPVFNGERHLDEAIRSILAQRHRRLELILVDDGSTDRSSTIIDRWRPHDPRVRALNVPHIGQSAAVNAGLALARGEFLARMDCDDIAHPDRIAAQVGFMIKHGLDVCGCWAKRFGDRSGVIRFAQSHAAIAVELMFTCPILDPAAMFRIDAIRAEPYRAGAYLMDHELWNRVIGRWRLGNIPRYLLHYRAHPGQSTATQATRFRHHQRMLRLARFRDQFPAAPAEDLRRFNRIIEATTEPLSSDELADAGDFFLRYLILDHPEARRCVHRRWRILCRHGVRPGGRRWRLFREIGGQLLRPQPSAGAMDREFS